MNLGVWHLEDKEEKEKEEARNADEDNEYDEDGQVEDSNEAMNEQAKCWALLLVLLGVKLYSLSTSKSSRRTTSLNWCII